jgi:eukaryotic-like serine/threonine-protein kinase
MTEPQISSAGKSSTTGHPEGLPTVPDHVLIRRIGAGGSGQVWLARNALGTYRAVKIVFEKNLASSRPFNGEFDGVMKFEPISRLHDGLVDILQVGGGVEVGFFYCVMELADGAQTGQTINPENYTPRTLARDLTVRRQLPIGECIRLGAPIASALGFMHRHGLIHRDITPANIIFVNGFPKLADSGLVAEMFQTGSFVGTEGYIAPEGPGTARSDIYSLGKVLYEISTGLDRNHYPELPAKLEYSREGRDLIQFNKIVLKAYRQNPLHRYKSAEEMLTALLSFQFSHRSLRQEKLLQTSTQVMGIAGISIGTGILVFLVWHFIKLLMHGS